MVCYRGLESPQNIISQYKKYKYLPGEKVPKKTKRPKEEGKKCRLTMNRSQERTQILVRGRVLEMRRVESCVEKNKKAT